MARLNFRQGIVRHQTDTGGNPTFLDVVGGNVSLIVSPDPTIIALIDGTNDYLFTESVTVSNAWGPFTAGINRWLYWDINRVTGVRTFGFTIYEPVEASTAPTSPNVGQMWFNTITNIWSEWSGSSWVPVIRVFACKLNTILQPESMSINAPSFTGTQVGLTGSFRVGAIAFDASGEPIRKGDGSFFTTEDLFVTGVPSGASLRVNNVLLSAQAQSPIAAYQVVQFSDFNKLVPAVPTLQRDKVFGIVEEDATTNEVVNFVVEGLIFNEDWDWEDDGADVNDPVYVGSSGNIELTPAVAGQRPIGTVVDKQSIIFAPRLFPQLIIQNDFIDLNDTPNNYVGAGSRFVKVNAAESALEFVADPGFLTDVDWGDIGGALANQTDLQTALDGKVEKTGDTMTGDLAMSSNQITGLADGTAADHAINLGQLQSAQAGILVKAPVRVATTTDLNSVGNGVWTPAGAGTGKTLTAGTAGTTTIDGILLADGDRVLVKDETAAVNNGIYIALSTGAGNATFFTRAEDYDGTPPNEVRAGSFTFVEEGTVNEKTGWVLQDTGSLTGDPGPPPEAVVDTDNLTFVKFQALPTGTTGADRLEDLLDVQSNTSGGSPGDDALNSMLVYDGAGTYVATAPADVRTALNLLPGVNIQIFSDVLEDLAIIGAPTTTDEFIVTTGVGSFAYQDVTTVRTTLDVYSTSEADSLFISTAGATITGFLSLVSGTGSPVTPQVPALDEHAINKKYADDKFVDRSGDTMSGNLSMGGNVLSNPLDPTAGTHVGDRDYNDNRYVNATGDNMSGNLAMGSNKITGLAAGTNPTDAANVGQLDSVLPTLTTSCNVLAVSEGSPLVVEERAIPELPIPYDLAGQIFGVAPDDAVVLKFVSPQKFVLFDYGHQGDIDLSGSIASGTPDGFTTFNVFVNGGKIGELAFFEDTGTPHLSANVGANNGWPNASGEYLGTFTTVEVGDIVTIKSPGVADTDMEDIALTLRGIILPAVPCGTIDVQFDKDASLNQFYDEASDTIGMTFSGSIAYVEWAVLGYVFDGQFPPTGTGSPLSTIIPLGDDFGGVGGTGRSLTFDVPGVGTTAFTTNQQYAETGTLTAPDITTFDDGGNGEYYLIRCTVFGPAGIATDVAWVKPT